MDERYSHPQFQQKKKKRRDSSGWRLWRILYPSLIKLGIFYVVSFVLSFAFMWYYLSQQSSAELESLMADETAIVTMGEMLSEQLLPYTAYIDGVAALLTIPLMIYLMRRDQAIEQQAGGLPSKKVPSWQYLTVGFLAIALCIGLNNLFYLGGLSINDESYLESMEYTYAASLPVLLLCLGVLTPVCEELVFRGLTYKRMRWHSKFLWSAIFSSLIFAIMHTYTVEVIYAFIMGMIFAYVYEKYESILAPIVAHMAANVVSILASKGGFMDWMAASPARIGVITVVCAAIASSMYVLMQRIEDQPADPGDSNRLEDQGDTN